MYKIIFIILFFFQRSKVRDTCFHGSGNAVADHYEIDALAQFLSKTYGTDKVAYEPQEIFGCYCSDLNYCNLKYVNLPSGSGSIGGSFFISLSALVIGLKM